MGLGVSGFTFGWYAYGVAKTETRERHTLERSYTLLSTFDTG